MITFPLLILVALAIYMAYKTGKVAGKRETYEDTQNRLKASAKR